MTEKPVVVGAMVNLKELKELIRQREKAVGKGKKAQGWRFLVLLERKDSFYQPVQQRGRKLVKII